MEYNPITQHPELGRLKFLTCPTHAITMQGDLNLFTLQPQDPLTAEICIQLTKILGTQTIPLARWPKPATPTGLLRMD